MAGSEAATRRAVAAKAPASAVKTTVLDSGIAVVTESMPDVRSVSLGIWVGVGSRDEPVRLAGVSHFLEHLLFKGTPDWPGQELAEQVDGVGGEMNAFTTKEYTAFYVRMLSEDLALGLRVLCDIVSRPALWPHDVESERQVILEEILTRFDEPSELVHDVVEEMAFAGHPLGRDTLGGQDTVTSITSRDIRRFMDGTYHGRAVVVAAAGHLDHRRVVKEVERHLDRQPPSRPLRIPPRRPPRAVSPALERRLRVVKADTEQVHVVVGFPALHRDDPDRYALAVVDHVLGGGLSSRLFTEVREKRGLAYSTYSYRSLYADAGILGLYAGTAPGRVTQVLDVLQAEIQRLVAQGVTEAELSRAKGAMRGGTALGLEDSGSRMSRIGRSRLIHGEVRPIDDLLALTAAVTLADCQRAIERVFCARRLLAVVGPVEEAAVAGHPVLADC